MSGLLTPSEAKAQAAVETAVRKSYRSDAEIAMRDVLEAWCRARWPDARLFHELVMGRGTVRADLAAIAPAHLVAFEIKGPWDGLGRLLHQIAMFRLAVPELWLVVAGSSARDAGMIRHLLPSVGLIEIRHAAITDWDRQGADDYGHIYGEAWGGKVDRGALTVEVIAESARFEPHPEALLDLLWVAELDAEAARHRVGVSSRKATHQKLVEALLTLTPAEQLAAVCRRLRRRDTMFRADAPEPEEA